MNYEIYIEESSIVRVLCNVIDDIYSKEDYTIQSEWNGDVPEDIMMKILIYGYMNDSYSTRKIGQRCKNLFIDGTKIEANANRYTFVWKKAVSKNEQKLRARLPEILDEIYSAYRVKFPQNTEVSDMISTLDSLMDKLGI